MTEAVVSISSIKNLQTTELEFTVVVLCEVDEMVAVKKVLVDAQQYNDIVDCYYYVANTPLTSGKHYKLNMLCNLYLQAYTWFSNTSGYQRKRLQTCCIDT